VEKGLLSSLGQFPAENEKKGGEMRKTIVGDGALWAPRLKREGFRQSCRGTEAVGKALNEERQRVATIGGLSQRLSQGKKRTQGGREWEEGSGGVGGRREKGRGGGGRGGKGWRRVLQDKRPL